MVNLHIIKVQVVWYAEVDILSIWQKLVLPRLGLESRYAKDAEHPQSSQGKQFPLALKVFKP